MNAAQWLLSLSSLLTGTTGQHLQSAQSGGGETIYATVLRVSISVPSLHVVVTKSCATYTQKTAVEKPANPKNINYAYAYTEIDSGYIKQCGETRSVATLVDQYAIQL